MVMWLFEGIRRLSLKEARELPKQKLCVLCQGALLRMAERAPKFPYQWIPNGYICSMCNTCYMGVP